MDDPAISELAAARHMANVEGDEVEACSLLLELAALIKERDRWSTSTMSVTERVAATLWPESLPELQEAPPAGGNGARAPDTPTAIARPDGRRGPMRQWWSNGARSRPELCTWPQPIESWRARCVRLRCFAMPRWPVGITKARRRSRASCARRPSSSRKQRPRCWSAILPRCGRRRCPGSDRVAPFVGRS
jgi:hypothetical protein